MEGVIVGLLIVAIVIIVLVSVILVYLLKKQSFSGEGYDASKINEKLDVAVKSLNDIRIETGKMQTEFNVKLEAFEKSNAALREGNTEFIKELKNSTEKELKKSGEILENNLKNIEEQLEKIGERVSNSLKEVREDNTKQLEKIRETVDEKLQKNSR